jgi:hypothetical protein
MVAGRGRKGNRLMLCAYNDAMANSPRESSFISFQRFATGAISMVGLHSVSLKGTATHQPEFHGSG